MAEHPQYQAGRELDHWPTTDELVALSRTQRQGEAYPTLERLREDLPVVLRGLCDEVLSGEDEAYPIAYTYIPHTHHDSLIILCHPPINSAF